MVDFDSLPGEVIQEPAAAAPQQPAKFDDLKDETPKNFDSLQNDADKYASTGQHVGAIAEGAARGLIGPLAPLAERGLSELGVPGLSPEEQAGREAAYPTESKVAEAAALIGGALIPGLGEYTLASNAAKAGEAISGAAGLGKIGAAALNGAIQGGIFQTSDEINNAMLGKGDPEAPVSSALAHIGAAGLFTGGIGGAIGVAGSGLSALADTKLGQKAAQFVEDFGNRWKYHQENPDLVTAIKNELSEFHGSTASGADEVYGTTGLKAQAIEKLVPEMSPAIQAQNQTIADKLQSKVSEMIQDPEAYPTRLTKKLMGDTNRWMEVATNPDATSNEVFNATQELKQKLQAYSKFDKQVGPLSAEQDFIQLTKDLQHGLVKNLEDTSVWGKAGELQKEVNGAFKEFLPAHKDFLSKFTEKVEGEPVISPGKINTYVNQLGRPSAEIKQGMLRSYIDSAEKYRDKIDSLYSKLGVESPIQSSSLSAVKGTLGENPTLGAKAADGFFHTGANTLSSKLTSATLGSAGAAEGYREGGVKGAVIGAAAGFALPHLEKAVAARLKGYAVPAVLRALGQGNSGSLSQVIGHADNVTSGAQKIKSSIDNLFKAGTQQVYDDAISEKERKKIKKYVEDGTLNQEMQQDASAPTPEPTPAFAEGGEVPLTGLALARRPVPQKNAVAESFPEQNILLNTAKGRVNNYLNSVRPIPNLNQLPFDKELPNKLKEKSYDHAIKIAAKPLSILNQVKAGNITPEAMQHFTGMYPELHSHLSKKLNESIINGKLKGDKQPPYRVRQAMSLFLGRPVDSCALPQNIQAAQSAFAQQAQQSQQPSNKAPSQSKMNGLNKLPQSYQTPAQSRQQRQNKV